MIIVAGGDSFIWGSDLPDVTYNQFSLETYPALLAKSKGWDYECCARPGNSNDAIARQTMLACDNIPNENIVALVSWTFMPRFEFMFTYDVNSVISPWASINNYKPKKEVSVFSEIFFKNVGTNVDYQLYNTLRAILILQTYFRQKQITYMFTLADNNAIGVYNDSMDINLKILWNMIDWSPWYFFPKAQESWLTTTPRGFYQWAVENKYNIGTTQHPLIDAHNDAANLMKEKFDEMVKKHI